MTTETDNLRVSIDRTDGVILVSLKGSATMVDTEILQQELHRLTERRDTVLVIDLSELDFIGADGLDVFVAGRAESALHHGQVRLVHPNPEIRRMLELTRLTEIFPIYDSIEDAIKG